MLRVVTDSGAQYLIDYKTHRFNRIEGDQNQWRGFQDVSEITLGERIVFECWTGDRRYTTPVKEIHTV